MVQVGFILVQLIWFMVCNWCKACMHGSWFGYRGMLGSSIGLAIGGMPVSSVGFGYRWDACERWLVWLQV
jgi:hypothetical protein